MNDGHANGALARHPAGARSTIVPEPADEPLPPCLPAELPAEFGDYRIERELGRGGMGIVFAATQRSLGRCVALKLLSPPYLLHSRALWRFEREARLLAHLDHPGIVRVIEAGTVGDVPYFAMDLVHGAPLCAIVAAVRRHGLATATGATVMAAVTGALLRDDESADDDTATPPVLAGLGYLQACAEVAAQVADALACAHAAGVVHRDVKPSNVLLRADGAAVLTDFGLARQEGGPSVTVTGDFAGTPYYVSPEQARGEALDHRTDIYSLGVTLYELITLQRPFASDTSAGALVRIQREEPTDPRRLHAAIPADLAAIVGKAMAKEPAQRYASAGELALDLRAFGAGEPVRARQPTRWQQLRRWARREPWRAAMLATAATAVLLVAGVTVAFMQRLLDETRRTRAAATLARENFAKAMEAVDQLSEVGARELQDHPQLAALRRRLLQRAASFYDELRTQAPGDARLQLQIARAHDRMGRVRYSMGDRGAAATAHRDAITAFDALLPAGQCVADARLERTMAQVNLATTLSETDQEEAERLLRVAIDALHAAGDAAHEPARHWTLALAQRIFGDLEMERDSHAAAAHYRAAIAELQALAGAAVDDVRCGPTLVSVRKALANYELARGNTDAAEQQLELARHDADALLARHPEQAEARRLAASIKDQLAILHHGKSRPVEAIAAGEAAVADWRQLVREAPQFPTYQESLGAALHNLAGMRYGQRDIDGASEAIGEAISVLDALVAACPDVPRYRHRLTRALLRALGGDEALPYAAEAAARDRILQRARRLAEELHGQWPDNVDYVKALVEALTRDAAFAAARGEVSGAVAALQRASEVGAAAVARDPGRLDLQDTHGIVLECLAEQQMKAGDFAAARTTLEPGLVLLRAALAREARRPPRRMVMRALLGRAAAVRAELGDHGGALAALAELRVLCDGPRDLLKAAAAAAAAAEAAVGDARVAYVERAFALLQDGAASGQLDGNALAADAQFAALRGDPRFTELQRALAAR